MTNTILTPDMIAKAAAPEFFNALNMTPFIDRQHSSEFSNAIGDSIKIRKLTRFIAGTGADVTSSIQDIEEGSVLLTLDQRRHVAVNVSSQEMTLDIKDFTEQVVNPAMEELAQVVESDVASFAKEVWNQVGTPGTTPSTIADAMLPRTRLNKLGVPMKSRAAFYEPEAAGAMAAVLATVFPTRFSELAIAEGEIRKYAGFVYMENQSIYIHTVGDHSGTPLINGAAQNVTYASVKDTYAQSLITDGWTSGAVNLNQGDRFTIADVYEVNPKTRQTTSDLQVFVINADISDTTGDITMNISPPIITSGAQQTVDSAPADGAAITVLGVTGAQYPQNLAFQKEAFTIAFANLHAPMDSSKSGYSTQDSITIRVAFDWNGTTDVNLVRFDILYGKISQNPGFATVHVG